MKIGHFFQINDNNVKKRKKNPVIFRGSDGTRKTPLIHFENIWQHIIGHLTPYIKNRKV